jgi:hypothetical protein
MHTAPLAPVARLAVSLETDNSAYRACAVLCKSLIDKRERLSPKADGTAPLRRQKRPRASRGPTYCERGDESQSSAAQPGWPQASKILERQHPRERVSSVAVDCRQSTTSLVSYIPRKEVSRDLLAREAPEVCRAAVAKSIRKKSNRVRRSCWATRSEWALRGAARSFLRRQTRRRLRPDRFRLLEGRPCTRTLMPCAHACFARSPSSRDGSYFETAKTRWLSPNAYVWR